MNIYRGIDADGKWVSFVMGDIVLPSEVLSKAVEAFCGTPMGTPAKGTVARKIATVDPALNFVTKETGEEMFVDAVPYEKPDVGRKPKGQPGTWAVQSLMFEKATFDAVKARAWINDHGDYGDYGMDEGEGGKYLRFRQYDPEHFSRFRVVKDMLGKGVSVVYGLVGTAKRERMDAEAEIVEELETFESLRREVVAHRINELVSEKVATLNKSLVTENVIGWDILDKADEERGIATGIVLEPNDGEDDTIEKPDTQNEVFARRVVEDTSYDWLAKGGAVDFMHSFQEIHDERVEVVESWLTRAKEKHGEYEMNPGTWMMSARFDTAGKYWQGIKDGKFQAWSPGGLKRYIELEE